MSTPLVDVQSENAPAKKVRFKENFTVIIYFVEEGNRLWPTPNFTKRSKPSTLNEMIIRKLETSTKD